MYVRKHKFMFKSLITDSNERRCIRYASLTCVAIVTLFASWQKKNIRIMMKFFIILLPKDDKRYRNQIRVLCKRQSSFACSKYRFRTYVLSELLGTFQFSNIYICYETSYNRIVELNSETSACNSTWTF